MYLHLISLFMMFFSEPQSDINSKLDLKPATKNSKDCVDSRSRPGKCITLAKCPDIIEEFYDEARKLSHGIDFQTFVSSSICGIDGSNFLICCSSTAMQSIVMAQPSQKLQNSPPAFAATGKPPSQPSPAQTNTFLFAPLSGNDGTQTTSAAYPPIYYMPPVLYPPAGGVSNPSPTMSGIILQPTTTTPTTQTSNVITTVPVLQPIPGSDPTQGTVYQPLPQPVTTTATLMPQNASGMTCGISHGTTNRVVGGAEAKRGTYPWMAALGYRDELDASALKFLCAGSLISTKYVITSAHCINPYLTLVRLGAHDLTKPTEADAHDYRVKRTVVNENFDLKSISNDIALIELAEQVVMTNFISFICLPESASFLTQDFVGMNPFVAGWGATKYQAPTSNVLRDVQVPIISRQICEQNYRTVFNFVQFSEKLICAGNSNVDACQGDSGGPLMLPQTDGTTYRYYLLGTVSYGYECARTGFPGVYTRVASYIPWIKKNMT